MDDELRFLYRYKYIGIAADLYEALRDSHENEWRREPVRREAMELVELKDGDEVIPARTRDVGPDSFGLISKHAVEPFITVGIRFAFTNDEWTKAEVMHCTPILGSYKIGLKLF
jgi:hypothetical protein